MSGRPDLKRTLSYDTSRFPGRYDFDPDVGWCPERDTCQRHLAFTRWDREAGLGDYQLIPVSMARKDCQSKIEVEQ